MEAGDLSTPPLTVEHPSAPVMHDQSNVALRVPTTLGEISSRWLGVGAGASTVVDSDISGRAGEQGHRRATSPHS